MNTNTSTQTLLSKGIRLGDYEIVRPIGSGGMGDVYEVLNHGLNEPVKRAIKTIPNDVKNDEMAVLRMKREVAIAQELSHPHIVRVYGYETYQDHHFIVMEYVEGPNLEKYIFENGGKLDLETSLDMLRGIAEALDYAHALQEPVIHRDIKPKNLLYDNKEKILKISDFGIASKIRSESSMISQVSSITSGSPPYMPYEQFMGDKPSIDMDTYAFAIVLYEMLSGEPPFTNGDFALQHKEKEVAELSVLSEAQNKVIEKALSKEVEHRYRNVCDIISDISGNVYTEGEDESNYNIGNNIIYEIFEEINAYDEEFTRNDDIRDKIENMIEENIHLIEAEKEKGNLKAKFILGYYYTLGLDNRMMGHDYQLEVIKDGIHDAPFHIWFLSEKKKERQFLIKAAKYGNVRAEYKLAILYRLHRSSFENMLLGNKILYKTVYKIFSKIQYAIELSNTKKNKKKKNEKKYEQLIKRAAFKGYAPAENELGDIIYIEGKNNFPRYTTEAMKWFISSAEKGYPEAQYTLGRVYAGGIGDNEKDIEKAKYWYQQAAEQGHASAQDKLQELNVI